MRGKLGWEEPNDIAPRGQWKLGWEEPNPTAPRGQFPQHCIPSLILYASDLNLLAEERAETTR
jgi:hypothetical protein